MKSISKFMLILGVLVIIYALSTGVSLHAFTGIEDGIIQGSISDTRVFHTIDRAKHITLATNLISGIMIIALLWRINFQKNNALERN